MENLNLKTILARLRADTPKFWKKIRNWMVGCGTIGGALIAIPADYTTAIYNILPASLGGTLFTIGAVGTALASLAKTDDSQK